MLLSQSEWNDGIPSKLRKSLSSSGNAFRLDGRGLFEGRNDGCGIGLTTDRKDRWWVGLLVELCRLWQPIRPMFFANPSYHYL